jgi:hypothetical protein
MESVGIDKFFFRPFEVTSIRTRTLGLRRGLHSFALRGWKTRRLRLCEYSAGACEGSFDRLDDRGKNLGGRRQSPNLIVENLAYQSGVTKNTSHHGRWYLVGICKETLGHKNGNTGEFVSGLRKNGLSHMVACVGSGDYRGQEGGEVRRRVGFKDKVFVVGRAEGPFRIIEQLGILIFIAGAQSSSDGGASDPVTRAFVRDGVAPASGARSLAARVASVCNRTRTSDDDDARTRAERGFHGDDRVGNDFEFAGDERGDGVLDGGARFFSPCTGSADAGTGYLGWIDFRSGASLLNRLGNRGAGCPAPHARNVASAGGGGAQGFRFVADEAGGFGTPAVDA